MVMLIWCGWKLMGTKKIVIFESEGSSFKFHFFSAGCLCSF